MGGRKAHRGIAAVAAGTVLIGLAVVARPSMRAAAVQAPATGDSGYVVNDTHFHLTNYIQEGTDIRRFLEIMGDKVGRVALFGIPLQQTWSY